MLSCMGCCALLGSIRLCAESDHESQSAPVHATHARNGTNTLPALSNRQMVLVVTAGPSVADSLLGMPSAALLLEPKVPHVDTR